MKTCCYALTVQQSCICLVMDNNLRVRHESSGPSAGLTHLCQAASTNNNSACGYKQGKAHQSTIQNHFKLSRSCSPPPSLSQRLFFSHYFLIDPQIAPTVTFKVQQSVNMTQYKLFYSCSFCCFGFFYWHDFWNPYICSWSGSASGVS